MQKRIPILIFWPWNLLIMSICGKAIMGCCQYLNSDLTKSLNGLEGIWVWMVMVWATNAKWISFFQQEIAAFGPFQEIIMNTSQIQIAPFHHHIIVAKQGQILCPPYYLNITIYYNFNQIKESMSALQDQIFPYPNLRQ